VGARIHWMRLDAYYLKFDLPEMSDKQVWGEEGWRGAKRCFQAFMTSAMIQECCMARRAIMAKQIVMDATGDTRHEFDPTDAAAVAEAERRFKELTGAGFTAAVRRGEGRTELIRSFDPAAEETVFFPRLQSG
jgi:hypothetical protein